MSNYKGDYQHANEESTAIVLTILVPVVLCIGWYFIGKYFYAYERLAVYWVLSFGGSIPTDIPVLGWLTRQYLFFRYTDASDITFMGDALADSLVVNGFLLIVTGLFVISRYFYIDLKHPYARFGRQLNVYDMMYEVFPLYPHLRIIWKLRLNSRPLNVGLFRMPDTAKMFCYLNDLVALPYLDGEPIVDEAKAKKVFRNQMGTPLPKLTDDPLRDAHAIIKSLDNNELALMACILPRLNSCDEAADDATYKKGLSTASKLVTQYWEGFDGWQPKLPSPSDDPHNPLTPPPPPVDTRGCHEILIEHLQLPYIRKTLLKHAFVRTYIYDALQACRRVGKFPPCDLRWLMMLDRPLWLLISSAGRREPFWECAGVHAHYLYERKAGKACDLPQVNEAVYALVDELENRFMFTPQEKESVWAKQSPYATSNAKALTVEKARAAAKIKQKASA